VGVTKGSIQQRWYHHVWRSKKGSLLHFHNAIREYGPEAFELQELVTVPTRSEANQFEHLWIVMLRSYDRLHGYNMTLGGDSITFTDDVLAKLKGRQPFLGRKHSPETRHKMRQTHLGHQASSETRKKFSILRKGKPWSAARRAAQKRKPACNVAI
jgi:hypothetical protein